MANSTTAQAQQLYTLADVARLLKVQDKRLRELMARGEMAGPDVLVPGGGRKAARWSASRLNELCAAWRHPAAA